MFYRVCLLIYSHLCPKCHLLASGLGARGATVLKTDTGLYSWNSETKRDTVSHAAQQSSFVTWSAAEDKHRVLEKIIVRGQDLSSLAGQKRCSG